MLIVLLALRLAYAQYTSYNAVAGRLPGRCLPGDFDCGFGRCVPITSFHDGKPDCYDGSDEWCFFGQIKCGAYCVDMSQALGCLFTTRCDDSNRQPPWCSVSKEKLCGDPSAFPCRGYGECVLWPWLLDGKRHCIDGSDEDQLYVRALEFSFRCYYNRTKQVAMPAPLNYTDAFLALTNALPLPGFRPPQFPSIYPPLPTLPPPNPYFTPTPSFTLPPPVQLSRITGLPPLPPPFPTLLPTTSSVISPVIQPESMIPLIPTESTGAVFVPDGSATPEDLFNSRSQPPSTTSTKVSKPSDSPDFITGLGSQPLPPSVTPVTKTPDTSKSPDVNMGILKTTKHAWQIRGRWRTTTATPALPKSSHSEKLTHIQVAVGDNREDATHSRVDLSASASGQNENYGQGKESSITRIDLKSKENTADLVILKQTTVSPAQTATPGQIGIPNQILPLPGFQGTVNPKFRTTSRPVTGPSSGGTEGNTTSSSSSMRKPTSSGGRPASSGGPDAATFRPPWSINAGTLVSSPASSSLQPLETPSTETTTAVDSADQNTRNTCLMEMVRSSESRYPSRECQCPTGEMLVNNECEAHEVDLVFYKLDVNSACGETNLTPEQRKWIAIEKVGETATLPWCVRMNSNGDAIVNSVCETRCDLASIRNQMQDKQTSKASSSVEEAPLCDDDSTNYCHRYADCTVEDVRLKCICKPGTNDTSHGTGKVCDGIPNEDDCIMIMGACLIFWLIILLGLLLLIPLIIFLLLHCCPGRMNSVHPTNHKEGHGTVLPGKKHRRTREENRHISAMMTTLMAKAAGGQREMAMKMALAELEMKKERKKEKVSKAPEKSDIVEVEDASELTSATVINQNSAVNSVQPVKSVNGGSAAMREIDSLPGTVQPHVGETPIIEKIVQPEIVVQSSTPEMNRSEDKSDITLKSASPSSLTMSETAKTPSVVPSPTPSSTTHPLSIAQETPIPVPIPPSTPSPQTPSPQPSAPHLTQPALSQSSHQDSTQPTPPPPPPPPPPPTIPAVVEVHRSNEAAEREVTRQPTTQSTGVQPTIWETYQALGDQYSKQENLDRESSSSSLEALIQSRYPGRSPSKAASTATEQSKTQQKSAPLTEVTTPVPETLPPIVSEYEQAPPSKPHISQTDSSERSSRNDKLAEMLGVTLDRPGEAPASQPARPSLRKTDEQIVEEITRQGVVIPISPSDIPTLSFEDRAAERSRVAPSDSIRHRPRPPPASRRVVPSVQVTASERSKRPAPRLDRPCRAATTATGPVFVPKRAREQQKGRDVGRKPASTTPSRRAAVPLTSTRQLLKPPVEQKLHSSTDESDPEVATFKRLAESEHMKHPLTLARRRQRRPERQLSSISEKSAEIAAEAALQSHAQDYSISAPNTTRSMSQWHRHMLRDSTGEDASDDHTDMDIPRGSRMHLGPIKPRVGLERLKKKRSLWKPRENVDEFKPSRRMRLCEQLTTSESSMQTSGVQGPSRFSELVTSPEIPDVTLRRSLERLDLLEQSSTLHQGALTSRSHVRPRIKARKAGSGGSSRDRADRLKTAVHEHQSFTPEYARSSGSDSAVKARASVDMEMPSSSRTVHHALISRKIATRRHEMRITKSTSDLSSERQSSSDFGCSLPGISRSVDNLGHRPPWDSSPYRPDDQNHSEPFLPEIGKSTRYRHKSRSVVNSPLGSVRRSSSKFSMASLPIRSSSTFEFSPYFSPGDNGDKPPKENLWWDPAPRSFR